MLDVILTPREKHQLVSVLRELDPEAPPEKRRDPRRKVRLNLWIHVFKKSRKTSPLKAALVNVAPAGAGLIIPESLETEHKFLLSLRFREGGGWLVLCEVRNCTRLSHGQFKIGSRFLDKIDDPDGTAKPPLDWLL